MPARKAAISQAEIARAVKAVLALGLPVREVIATGQGVHVICHGDRKSPEPPNPWDEQ